MQISERTHHIALVEDDGPLRTLLTRHLRQSGFPVRGYATAAEFRASAERFDLSSGFGELVFGSGGDNDIGTCCGESHSDSGADAATTSSYDGDLAVETELVERHGSFDRLDLVLGGSHIDFGAETKAGGPPVLVDEEVHPLALAKHPENRAFEGINRKIELCEVARVTHHHTVAGAGVVGLDDALHELADRFFDLAGLKAAGADTDSLGATVDLGPNPLNVGVPATLGTTM